MALDKDNNINKQRNSNHGWTCSHVSCGDMFNSIKKEKYINNRKSRKLKQPAFYIK